MENQTPQLNPIFLNLLSGLVGSIIGAFVGAWATLKSSKESLKGLYDQEKKRRAYDEKKQNEAVIHSLLKELKENQIIAQEWKDKENKVLFSREAWATFKGQTSFMPEKLQQNLPYTYSLVSAYNFYIDADKYLPVISSGRYNDRMRAAAEKFAGNVGGVITQLEDLIKI